MKNVEGLNSEEVKLRTVAGLTNKRQDLLSRTVSQIVKSNVFTVFNALNIFLATLVLIAGSPKNALFVGVIFTNTIMGILQELKAKSTLEKLSLLNQHSVKAMRDGCTVSINPEDVVLDDIVILMPGDQVIADGQLLSSGTVEIDESSLTGESDPVEKSKNDAVLSGSFIVSGKAYLKITAVGKDTYTSKLSEEARKFISVNSELKNAVNKIIKTVIWLLFPIGSTLFISQILFSDKSWNEAVIGSIAGIVGMVPEGLVLLTTVSFLVGVIRLSKLNTLVQELPATEVLARVDTVCLDKTGTLTKGNLKVSDVIPLAGDLSLSLKQEIAATAHSFATSNLTNKAIIEMFPENPKFTCVEKIPFSSFRKWSGIRLEDDTVLLLGAPETLLGKKFSEISSLVNRYAISGKRVVLFGKGKNNTIEKSLNDISPLALLVIEDSIRSEAPETLKYFKEQDVDIKIISGDNPVTVSAVSKKAGVENADKYIDARDLPKDVESLVPFLKEYVVFGRVTPHQKRDLIKALKLSGKTVAMTGDGINDILALKESDCGIALSSGSESTKSVAQLVLLDSNFASLPKVVSEGRRIINNLERVASLYLTKTIYSILLSFIFAVTTLPYPFMPIHLTLVGALVIGIPSFFLALSPNDSKVEKHFLYRVLKSTVPKGIVVALSSFAIFSVSYFSGLDMQSTSTLTVIMTGGVSLLVLFKVAKPLSLKRAALVAAMTLLFAFSFVFPLGRDVFSFTLLSIKYLALVGVILAFSYFMMDLGSHLFSKLFYGKLKKIS